MNKLTDGFKILFLLLILIADNLMYSQQKVHVLTKTIKKEFKAKDKTLIVKSEKSTVNVTSWDNDFFYIEIKLISKNLDKKLAENDLAIIKYEVTETNTTYLLSNYFSSEKYRKITSNLSTIYNIKAPKGAKLSIINIYGNINIESISSTTSLKNSFGEIHIKDALGSYNVNSYYSDTWIENADLILKCFADKSDIELNNISGSLNIKSNYGKINLLPGTRLQKVEIDSKRTSVFFETSSIDKYCYNLSTKSSKIRLPEKWKSKIIKKDGYIQFKQIEIPDKPSINIKTSYCEILIKKK